MNRPILFALPLLAATALASDKTPMTEAEKIAWYCAQHPDEGKNCETHAKFMLPYISDYAKYPDTDVRGDDIKSDSNGCDFSPRPEGCPEPGGAGSTGDGGSGSEVQSGGTSIGGAGISSGRRPTMPIEGPLGARPGSGGGSGAGESGPLPLPPKFGCTEGKAAGKNYTICWNLAAMPEHMLMHGGMRFPNSEKAYSVGFQPGGGNFSCAIITAPPFPGQGCAGLMWISKAPGGPPVSKACSMPTMLDAGNGGNHIDYTLSATRFNGCVLEEGTRHWCNITLTMKESDWMGNVPDRNGKFGWRRKICEGIIGSPLGKDSGAKH